MIIAKCYRETALGQGLVFLRAVDLKCPPVGASLLAMADYHPKSMLVVPASSRAGSLPQGLNVFNNPAAYETPNARQSP